MVEIGITKMSSKGQVVIPLEMRKNLKEGEKLLVIEQEGKIVIKKATKMDEQLQEDLEFARKTEEAWQRFDKGEFISISSDEFLKELKKW